MTTNSGNTNALSFTADSEPDDAPHDFSNAIATLPVQAFGAGAGLNDVIRVYRDGVYRDSDPTESDRMLAVVRDFVKAAQEREFHIELLPAPLAAAQQELAEAATEAQEEGYPVPSELAFANARRLLPAISRLSPRPMSVYPTPDGEICIDLFGGFGRSVLLLCESGGGALCMVSLDQEHRRARYDTVRTLPDGFVREALAEMEHKPRE